MYSLIDMEVTSFFISIYNKKDKVKNIKRPDKVEEFLMISLASKGF